MATPCATVIAHRGASGHAPENSFRAFDLALKLEADVLELDLRATVDGTPVLVHDETLERTTGDPRPVATVTTTDLAALSPDLRPPTLAEVLARYGRTASSTPLRRRPRHCSIRREAGRTFSW